MRKLLIAVAIGAALTGCGKHEAAPQNADSGSFPDVLWDGYADPKGLVDGAPPADDRICLQDVNCVVKADGPHEYKNPGKDLKPFQCTLPKLAPIVLNPEPKA